MHETLERNGVLFYLATGSRRFAVLGDEELHKKVGEEFWRQAADLMNGEFKAGRFVEGLTAAIALVGAQLAEHFPRKSDDVNELPTRSPSRSRVGDRLPLLERRSFPPAPDARITLKTCYNRLRRERAFGHR